MKKDPDVDDATEYRDPGRDPNVFWGVCGQNGGRHRIYLMLPDAVESKIEDLHSSIYEANHESALLYLAENITTWSPTYEAELDRTARFSNSTWRTESRKSVAEDSGQAFADSVMDQIHQYTWGQNAYWFIQMRGTKDLTRHHGAITENVIDLVLTNVLRDQSIIFLDMGVEIHLAPGWASMPARVTDCHPEMAQILWGIDSGSDWDYQLHQPDVWAGVADIAGFRCNYAKAPRTRNRISYIQVYSSDKFQTYNASSEGSKALHLHGKHALNMRHPDVTPGPLTKVYRATCDNQTAATPTVTRFEARVPLQCAREVYAEDLSPASLREVIHVLPAKVIW